MARTGGVAENAERAVKKFVRIVGGVVTQAGHPRVDSLDRVTTWDSGQDEGLLDRRQLSADLLGIEKEVPEPARQPQRRIGTQRVSQGGERVGLARRGHEQALLDIGETDP
jgi:hypothetical protein